MEAGIGVGLGAEAGGFFSQQGRGQQHWALLAPIPPPHETGQLCMSPPLSLLSSHPGVGPSHFPTFLCLAGFDET